MTRVRADQMRPGDVWHMHDWRLHVLKVDIDGNSVAVFTEGPSMRHVPADELEEVDR